MLNNFSADLKNGKYTKKIDYSTWGYLKKATQIDIRFDKKNISVHSLLPSGVNHTCCFNYHDCGFGQFLMDNYLEEKTVGEETNLTHSNGGLYIKADGNWESLTGIASITADTYAAATTSNDCLSDSSISIGTTWAYPPNNVSVDSETFLTKEEFYRILNKEKEEDNMDTKKIFGSTFDFGPCGDTIRMSMYGLAVKNQAGEWVSYDSDNGEIVNVDVFNIAESGKWFYKMPVSVDDVAVGDLVIHAKKPCYVVDFNENTLNPIVIDIFSMERKEILLQRSPFGFNFATKVVSLFDGEKPSAKNPFGNMWMLMMLSNSGKMDDMLPLVMMSHCGNENTPPFGSPLMMYLMMKDNKNLDFLPFMLMMNQQKK